MVVVNDCAYFKPLAYSIFHNCAERVLRGSLRKREFGVSIRHAFGANEDKVEADTREEIL